MAKWVSYKKGQIRSELNKQLKNFTDKDWRKKKGLEDSPLMEFRKNIHWALHATTEVTEILMGRMDDIMKGTYIALDGQLGNLRNDMKAMVATVKRANAESNAEVLHRLHLNP